jgi:DnaJ-class molecular chaperone
MDNMMPGDNSGAEPREMDVCWTCSGTGYDPESDVQGVACTECEGTGYVEPNPDDYDDLPFYAGYYD